MKCDSNLPIIMLFQVSRPDTVMQPPRFCHLPHLAPAMICLPPVYSSSSPGRSPYLKTLSNVRLYKDVTFYQISFSTLLIHRDRLLSKFRSCAPCGTESNVPFSIDRRPGHPEFLHAILLDTMRCLSMPLQGRPRRSGYNDRRSFSLLAARTEVQCR